MNTPAGQTSRGPSPWERVDLSTPMIDLHLCALVVAGADDAMIAEVGGRYRHAVDPEEIPVRCWVVNAKRPTSPTVRAFTTVSALAASQGIRADRAMLLPPFLEWQPREAPHVLDRNGDRYCLTRVLDHLPEPRTSRAQSQVDEVRAEYGRLLGDVAYRIEASALFDSAVPTTRAFETALALWADSEGKPEAEVLRLAAMVRVTFETARAHAETVGLAHLPTEAQDPARRAAGAARLARSAPSEPERQAAQAQVTRILSSLALYYLPTPRAGELTP